MNYPDDFIDKIIQGDCLEVMEDIPDKSIDMILCDLPYGTTACKWDSIIPFEPLWEQYKRIIKDNRTIVLTASQPFTSALVMSNPEWFRHEWIWNKSRGHNFAQCNYMPMKSHENILVFSFKRPIYLPIKTVGTPYVRNRKNDKSRIAGSKVSLDNPLAEITINTGDRYPLSIQEIPEEHSTTKKHPTQKPVALFEYLIKTYTNEGDLVLDNCIGSGTTAVAAINTNRHFIGIEMLEEYCTIARQRIAELKPQEKEELGAWW